MIWLAVAQSDLDKYTEPTPDDDFSGVPSRDEFDDAETMELSVVLKRAFGDHSPSLMNCQRSSIPRLGLVLIRLRMVH